MWNWMPGKGITVILFVLFSAAAFWLMESYEHNPFREVRPKAQMFNLLLFELAALAMYLLTNGMRLAIRVELAAAMVFGLVNHYVMLFRSTPFVPCDLLSIKTAATVTDNYDFTPGPRVVIVTLGFVLLFILAHFLKNAPRPIFWFRFPMALLAVSVISTFAGRLQDEAFQVKHYLYPYLFTPAYMTKVNGMAVTFVMNLQYLQIGQPKGYHREEAKELLASYEEEAAKPGGYPNIIVIMDEAFSELAVLAELKTNVDYMPFFHELQQGAEHTVTGYAQVSVCGGNTANSEFEFLTGHTMAFLPNGSIPYQQYINGEIPSLASHLAELGYQTLAQHPYYASGWERDEVYPRLGFDQADFIDGYWDRSYVRNYISDACDFAHVIRTYEEKEPGRPAFIFNVTMQNHGGYTEEYENFTEEVEAEGGSAALNRYLSLLKLTDESLRVLIRYFAEAEEPTVIVFFGDHQPNDFVVRPVWRTNGIDSSNLTGEQQRMRYQVPFLIWANYDIPEGTGVHTSLNYLAGYVLELAGVPKSAYQNYLSGLQEHYPVISAAELMDTGTEELLTYQRLQYYQLFDYDE